MQRHPCRQQPVTRMAIHATHEHLSVRHTIGAYLLIAAVIGAAVAMRQPVKATGYPAGTAAGQQDYLKAVNAEAGLPIYRIAIPPAAPARPAQPLGG